eukprot:122289_1
MAAFYRKRECGMCGKYLRIDVDFGFCQYCGFNIQQEEFTDLLHLQRTTFPSNQCQTLPIYKWNNFVYFWFLFKYKVQFYSPEGMKHIYIEPCVIRFETTKTIQWCLLGVYNLVLYGLDFNPTYITQISLPRKYFGDSQSNIKSNQFATEIQHCHLQPLLFSYYAMCVFNLKKEDIKNPVVFAVNSEQIELVKEIDDLKEGMTMRVDTKLSDWPYPNRIVKPSRCKNTKFADIIVVIGFIKEIENEHDMDIPLCIRHLCVLFFTKYPNQK